MSEQEVIGWVLIALITIGSFLGIVMKLVSPLNELKVVIKELTVMLGTLKEHNEKQDLRITTHGKEIEKLQEKLIKIDVRVSTLQDEVKEFKMLVSKLGS